MTFGEQLVKLRKSKNFTNAKLSKELGVSCQTILKWEDDKEYPNIQEVVEMSRIFQVTVEQMIADLEFDDKTSPQKFDNETKGTDRYFGWLSFFATVIFILGVITLILDFSMIGEAFLYYFSLVMVTISVAFFLITWISYLRK